MGMQTRAARPKSAPIIASTFSSPSLRSSCWRITSIGYRVRPAQFPVALLLALSSLGSMTKGKPPGCCTRAMSLIPKIYNEERGIVSQIERVPGVTQIFQLPNVGFPPGAKPGDWLHSNMTTAGHTSGRPGFDGVGPGFSDRHDTWVNAIGEPKGQQFISNLVASGFNGLWLDRYGYHDADTIQTSLTDRLGQPAFVSLSGRYVFYSLTSQQAEWQRTPEAERREQQSKLMDATTLRYGDGLFDRENVDG